MKVCRPKVSAMTRLLVAAVWLAAGCSVHESFDSTSDYDAVVTVKDPAYDYAENRTYAVVEELADLSDFTSDPIEIKDFDKWEKLIIEGIHRNMKDAGYTEETGNMEDADVVVAAGAVAAEHWALYGYYPWWGWYGWYYYPGITVAVDMSFGSVMMVMIDPDRTEPLSVSGSASGTDPDGGTADTAYPAVWGAVLRGLLSSVDERKVSNGIDQAFKQSPYLAVGGGDK